MDKVAWTDLPFTGSGLDELRYFGCGKDAYMELRLTDGRRFLLSGNELRVTASTAMTVRTRRCGDVTLDIRYSGANLVIRRAQVGYNLVCGLHTPEENLAEFRRDLAGFLEAEDHRELMYTVDLEIELAPAG
jgi:hypothetical protein